MWLVLGRSDLLSHFNGDLNFTLLIPAFTAYQNQNYFVGSLIEFNADTTFNIYSNTLPATQSRSVEKMMGGGRVETEENRITRAEDDDEKMLGSMIL